jgi:phage shock protein C
MPGSGGLRLTGCPLEGHDRSMNGSNGQKQLIRPKDGRMIAGVCAGVGQFFGIDANLVRIVFAVLTLFSAGAAALVYLLAWVVVPEEGESGSIAENYLNKKKQ